MVFRSKPGFVSGHEILTRREMSNGKIDGFPFYRVPRKERVNFKKFARLFHALAGVSAGEGSSNYILESVLVPTWFTDKGNAFRKHRGAKNRHEGQRAIRC